MVQTIWFSNLWNFRFSHINMVNTQNINIYFLGGWGGGQQVPFKPCLGTWQKACIWFAFLGNSLGAVETRRPGNVNYRQKFYKFLSSSAKTANELWPLKRLKVKVSWWKVHCLTVSSFIHCTWIQLVYRHCTQVVRNKYFKCNITGLKTATGGRQPVGYLQARLRICHAASMIYSVSLFDKKTTRHFDTKGF